MAPVRIPKSRIIVNRTVIHAMTTGNVEELVRHVDGSYVRLLYGDEHPYKRCGIKVGEEAAPLSFEWCSHPSPSLVVVLNEEGHFRHKQPTPEEREAVLARVVVLTANGEDFALVRPYENTQFEPAPGVRYGARCQKGVAEITVVALPGDVL